MNVDLVIMATTRGGKQKGDIIAVLDSANRPDDWGVLQRKHFLMAEDIPLAPLSVAAIRPDMEEDAAPTAYVDFAVLRDSVEDYDDARAEDRDDDYQPFCGRIVNFTGAIKMKSDDRVVPLANGQ